MEADTNKTILDRLASSTSDWIVIDASVFAYDLLEARADAGTEYLTSNVFLDDDTRIDMIKIVNSGVAVRRIANHDHGIEASLPRLIEFLRHRYGNKIILIKTGDVSDSLDEKGNIVPRNEKNRDVKYETDLMERLKRELGCFSVDFPKHCLTVVDGSDDDSANHYCSEYYKYAMNAVQCIVELHHTPERIEYRCALYLKECEREIQLFRKRKMDAGCVDERVAIPYVPSIARGSEYIGYIECCLKNHLIPQDELELSRSIWCMFKGDDNWQHVEFLLRSADKRNYSKAYELCKKLKDRGGEYYSRNFLLMTYYGIGCEKDRSTFISSSKNLDLFANSQMLKSNLSINRTVYGRSNVILYDSYDSLCLVCDSLINNVKVDYYISQLPDAEPLCVLAKKVSVAELERLATPNSWVRSSSTLPADLEGYPHLLFRDKDGGDDALYLNNPGEVVSESSVLKQSDWLAAYNSSKGNKPLVDVKACLSDRKMIPYCPGGPFREVSVEDYHLDLIFGKVIFDWIRKKGTRYLMDVYSPLGDNVRNLCRKSNSG